MCVYRVANLSARIDRRSALPPDCVSLFSRSRLSAVPVITTMQISDINIYGLNFNRPIKSDGSEIMTKLTGLLLASIPNRKRPKSELID